jgi:YidC/Oxa1 family membrane protein insertase
MGDPMQQKLMTWMMPLMMLFFLYGMPAALSLYWTVSTLLAIVQMKWQLRSGLAAETAAAPAAPAEHLTRQQRRLQERQGK